MSDQIEMTAGGSGDPRADSRGFRQCLGDFATGVTVMTAEAGGERVGVTANSFSSLSLDPPLVLWSLSRSSRSRDVFERAGSFAVNVLALDQIALSQTFSSSSGTKFEQVGWRGGRSGSPLLEDVLAVLECRTTAVHDGGDHLLFIGAVERFERFGGRPLLFAQGAYGAATDHPTLVTRDASSLAMQPGGAEDAPLTALLSRTYHMLTLRFSEQRAAEGITENEYRVLAALYDFGMISPEELEEHRYFPHRELEDALAELTKRGDVTRSPEGQLSLTSQGRERRLAIMVHAERFRAEQFVDLSAYEITTVKHVLSKLLGHGPRRPA